MRNIQNRFKSKVVWISVASLLYLILQKFDLINITQMEYNEIVDGIIAILLLLGILNNPSDNSNF